MLVRLGGLTLYLNLCSNDVLGLVLTVIFLGSLWASC